ncbi:MAG: ATP-binding protein [Candidatus Methanofastidiosia archaeon]
MEMKGIIVKDPLNLMTDGGTVYVGRKPSVFEKYKDKGGLYIGKISESAEHDKNYYGKNILIDSISPHAIFICGMRGSGKSYTLGVIAEEIATKNEGVGVIIIDPMGIFWSMKKPNKIAQEKDFLKEWGLYPHGFKNVQIFLPKGHARDAPKDTYDKLFTIRPSEISVEEWCLTFNIDRFETIGLLIERIVEKVKSGYTTVNGERIDGKGNEYDITDMVDCINNDESINSSSRGFKQNTRRALVARLNGAMEWGIFAKEGTQLKDLSKRGKVSVIDVSFLEDNVRALIVGILSRNLLNTRKMISRHEATGVFEDIFDSIPVTWLMIDEAHILVPASSQKTAATDSILEYVRQGRQPGCSLVLATQQPSAIDSRVLSQTDILICHKLIYDDDIKAVTRRMPSEMPAVFKDSRFIKNIPIGMTIIGDKQEQTSRAFLARIRPRISQHEGRERTSTLEVDPDVMRANVKKLIVGKYHKEGREELEKIVGIVKEEYKIEISLDEILEELATEGKIKKVGMEEAVVSKEADEKDLWQEPADELNVEDIEPEPPDFEGESFVEETLNELKYSKERIVLERIDTSQIDVIAEKKKKRKIFGSKEAVISRRMIYYPLWRVLYDYFPKKKRYTSLATYVDGIMGEIIIKKRKTGRTKGMREVLGLNKDEREFMLYLIERENPIIDEIVHERHMHRRKANAMIEKLISKRLVKIRHRGKNQEIIPRISFDVVKSPLDKRMAGLDFEIGEEFVEKDSIIEAVITAEQAKKMISVFRDIQIWGVDCVYYPYWVIVYSDGASRRIEVVDAVTGKTDEEAKNMLKFRLT